MPPIELERAELLVRARKQELASTKFGADIAVHELTSARAGRAYVIAWELGRTATPKAAWGPRGTVNQTFLARS